MFLLFTFIILGVMLIIAYVYAKGDFASPIILSIGIFTLVVFTALLNIGNWKSDISLGTMALLLFALFNQWTGDCISRCIVKGKRDNSIKEDIIINIVKIRGKAILFTIYAFIVLLRLIITNGKILYSLGYSYHSDNFLFYLRHKEALGYHGSTDYIGAIMTYSVTGISFIFLFVLIKLFSTKKITVKSGLFYILLLSQVPFFGINFLSTGRDGILQYFSIMLVCLLCYMRKATSKITLLAKKTVKIVTKVIGTFITLFLVFGIFTGKTVIGKLWSTISIYVGSSIIAFDKLMESSSISKIPGLKFRSLFGLYTLLEKFGVNVHVESRAENFISVGGNAITNIYTSLLDYYGDFGILGLALIQISLGLFMGFLFYKSYTKKYDFWIIIYSFYSYMLVRQITEAYFLKMSFTVIHTFTLFFIIVGYCWVLNPVFNLRRGKIIKIKWK